MLDSPLFLCLVTMHVSVLMWYNLDFFDEFFGFDSVNVYGFPCLAGAVLVNSV